MDAEALERQLRAFLAEKLGVDDAGVSRDDELLSTGRIDSADLVLLATFLEQRLGISVPDRDINANHFDCFRGWSKPGFRSPPIVSRFDR